MAKTVIINRHESDDSETALWVVLLVAFGVVLIAIVGFGERNSAPRMEEPIQVTSRSANPS